MVWQAAEAMVLGEQIYDVGPCGWQTFVCEPLRAGQQSEQSAATLPLKADL